MLSLYNDIESDQPWDQIWEYVLGDDLDDESSRDRSSSFRRHRSEDAFTADESSFMEDPILFMEDPTLFMTPTEKPETKRRPSFTRGSSFTRQSSNQSNSTTGSNSSFRLRGVLNRGKRSEEQDQNSETASFLPALSSVFSSGDDGSTEGVTRSSSKEKQRSFLWKKGDDGSTEGSTRISSKEKQRSSSWGKGESKSASPPDDEETLFEAITLGFDDTIDESQEVVLPRKEKKKKFLRFSKKKEEHLLSSSSSVDVLLAIAPSFEPSDQATSPKREKRKFFGKRKEQKDRSPPETAGFITHLTLGGLEGGNEDASRSQEMTTSPSSPGREKRKFFGKRKEQKNSSPSETGGLLSQLALGGSEEHGNPETGREQGISTPPSREKRKFFGKRKENKDPPQSETGGFMSHLTLGSLDDNDTEDVNGGQEITLSPSHEKRNQFFRKRSSSFSDQDADGAPEIISSPSQEKRRQLFRKRTSSSSKTAEEDRSDLESIEAMLGPWDTREESEEIREKDKKDSSKKNADNKASSFVKRPLKSALKKNSKTSEPKTPDTYPISLWQTHTPEPSVPQTTKHRQSILKAVSKFGGGKSSSRKNPGKAASDEKSESDLKRTVICGPKVEDESMNPFYTNPVFLSSFSEDSTNQETETARKSGFGLSIRSRSKERKARLNQGKDEDDRFSSFLPQSLLLLQSETGVQNSASTESSTSGVEKPFEISSFIHTSSGDSIGSSIDSSISEQGQTKKSVKWADEVNSSDQESSNNGGGFPLAGIRKVFDPSWLYSMSSSDSESSMASSANRSSQSEDLSSVPTDSDVSMSGASVTEKGDPDKEEQQNEIRLRFASGGFVERINQLPPIDENESFRGSLGDDGQDTFDTTLAVLHEGNEHSDADSILDKTEKPVHKQISVIQRKDGGTEEMTTIEPRVSQSTFEGQNVRRSANIDALILKGNPVPQESKEESEIEKESTEIKSLLLQESSLENSKKAKGFDCVLVPPIRRKKGGLESRVPICKALRHLSDEDLVRVMESGVPVHELTYEELAEIFPKIRMVADEKGTEHSSMVLGNSNSFDDSRPALFQVPSKAIKPALGLQSLYEYDFTSGKHMSVSYGSCGADPKSSLSVTTHDDPPESSGSAFALIQVEASTISNTDCRTRRDGWFGNKRIDLPNTPGVDVVGKIYRIDFDSSKKTGLKKGDRVISLVSQGGNSRFLSVNPSSLVKIPEKIDPAEAVCLVETYLTAFQTLHYNQSFLTRYRKTSLQNKTILIIGGMSANMARAMSQLAQFAGSRAIFATCRKKDFKFLSENGILPLSTDPLSWWEQLAGGIDLLISLDEEVIPLHYKLLKQDGIVVVSSSEFHEDLMMYEDTRDPLKRKFACSTARSQAAARTAHYDLFEEWESSPMKAKKDLSHLVELLEKRKVIPHVLDRVPLSKVADIQDSLEKRRAPGHYVCEPWLVSKSRAVSL